MQYKGNDPFTLHHLHVRNCILWSYYAYYKHMKTVILTFKERSVFENVFQMLTQQNCLVQLWWYYGDVGQLCNCSSVCYVGCHGGRCHSGGCFRRAALRLWRTIHAFPNFFEHWNNRSVNLVLMHFTQGTVSGGCFKRLACSSKTLTFHVIIAHYTRV